MVRLSVLKWVVSLQSPEDCMAAIELCKEAAAPSKGFGLPPDVGDELHRISTLIANYIESNVPDGYDGPFAKNLGYMRQHLAEFKASLAADSEIVRTRKK